MRRQIGLLCTQSAIDLRQPPRVEVLRIERSNPNIPILMAMPVPLVVVMAGMTTTILSASIASVIEQFPLSSLLHR